MKQLGLEERKRVIKAQYYQLCQAHHPDHLQLMQCSAAEKKEKSQGYLVIQEAYFYLKENPQIVIFNESDCKTTADYHSADPYAFKQATTKERPEFKKAMQVLGLGFVLECS